MTQARKDENKVSTIIGVSSVDLTTPTLIAVNPTTGAVIIDPTNLDSRYVNVTGDTMTGKLSIAPNPALIESLDIDSGRFRFFTQDLQTSLVIYDTAEGNKYPSLFLTGDLEPDDVLNYTNFAELAYDVDDVLGFGAKATILHGSGDIVIKGTSSVTPSLFFDTTNFRAGIGTTTPSVELEVQGDTLIQSKVNSTTAVQVQQLDDTVVLNVDTTNARVGIGIASPQELLHVGTGTDASDISATDLLVTRAGPSNLSVRDSTNNVETFLFASSVGGVMGTITNDPLDIKTNNTSAIFIDASQKVGIGITILPTNATKLTIEGGLTFKEISAPTADDAYGKIWTESNNELFYQSGDGNTHLLHGDAFSNIWFHNVTPDVVEITTAALFTLVDSFENIGEQDDLSNAVGNTTNNDITIGAGGAGKYKMTFHASISSETAASEMVLAMGVTLNTPIDVTGASNTTPIIVTSNGHGLMNGDMVTIDGGTGNGAVDGDWIVTSVSANAFTLIDLTGANSVGNGPYDASSADVTIKYPGNLVIHREVGFGALGVGGANADVSLAVSDKVKLYVANVDATRDLLVAIVNMELFRIGD